MLSEPGSGTTSEAVSDTLLVGCGDLGADIGLRLADRGHRVVGIRRRGDLVPAPLLGVSADLTKERPVLPPLDLDYLVVSLTARPRTEAAYRETYVEGLGRALDALDAAGQTPRRAVLVSSTAVYGVVAEGETVDETTPARPADGPGRMLLEAEQVFTDRVPGGTVLRLSGLYGRGPSRLVKNVRAGVVNNPDKWTNRIHRDDAASAVVHLLTSDAPPDSLYIGTDNEPAIMSDVAAFLAHRFGAPRAPRPSVEHAHGKTLSNARLRASGWEPAFPTYREGYRDYPPADLTQ